MKTNIRLLIYRGLILLAIVCEGVVLGGAAYLIGNAWHVSAATAANEVAHD